MACVRAVAGAMDASLVAYVGAGVGADLGCSGRVSCGVLLCSFMFKNKICICVVLFVICRFSNVRGAACCFL